MTVFNPHDLTKGVYVYPRGFAAVAFCPKVINAEFPKGEGMFAFKAVLHQQGQTGIHMGIVKFFAQGRAVFIDAYATADFCARQQCSNAPFGMTVLIQDIPFQFATYEGFQRVLQILLIPAIVCKIAHQIRHTNSMAFLSGRCSRFIFPSSGTSALALMTSFSSFFFGLAIISPRQFSGLYSVFPWCPHVNTRGHLLLETSTAIYRKRAL